MINQTHRKYVSGNRYPNSTEQQRKLYQLQQQKLAQ